MFLWAIYIFLQSVCLSCCRKIGEPIVRIFRSLKDTWMWKLELRRHQFLFWEHIKRNFFAVQCGLRCCRLAGSDCEECDDWTGAALQARIIHINDHAIIVKLMQMSCSRFSFDNLSTGGATGLDFPAQSSPIVSKMASSVKKKLRKSLS